MFNDEYASNYNKDDVENIFNREYNRYDFTQKEIDILEQVFSRASSETFHTRKDYEKFMLHVGRREFKLPSYSKVQMRRVYNNLLKEGKIEANHEYMRYLKMKAPRGWSGVNVVTIFTSGNQMGKNADESVIKKGGCPMDCFYCPFEKDEDGVPTQPRSYLSTEPGNMRATQNKHHPVGQSYDRIHQLELMGHISSDPSSISKIEGIISGGTFNFYPKDYLRWFVTSFYYACNTYYDWQDTDSIKMGTLEEEQTKNETASLRVIGLTIETRPDYVAPVDKNNPAVLNLEEVRFLREIGATRVQIGLQHTDDYILKKVNRQCTLEQTKRGLRILKQNGIKTDIHLMFDLPYSSPEKDIECVKQVISDPDLQADQWKLYPTETTPFTKIKEWYDKGLYNPYAEDNTHGLAYKLVAVLKYTLIHCPPWIRVNRVVRDIPHKSIDGGLKCGNLRQIIEDEMKKDRVVSNDIRQREVKMNKYNLNDIKLFSRRYIGSKGTEYFISYESKDAKILYGFIRLRLNHTWDETLDTIKNCAFVRELHVYGEHTPVSDRHKETGTQHRGLGGKLLRIAEEIAFNKGYLKMAIIAGCGVRAYYAKKGYTKQNTYMQKRLCITMFPQLVLKKFAYYTSMAMFAIIIVCIFNFLNIF
jgi:ELP3 family radical SAM enzyme/protein acetyltransferase